MILVAEVIVSEKKQQMIERYWLLRSNGLSVLERLFVVSLDSYNANVRIKPVVLCTQADLCEFVEALVCAYTH